MLMAEPCILHLHSSRAGNLPALTKNPSGGELGAPLEARSTPGSSQ